MSGARFLEDKVARHGVVQVRAVSAPRPQSLCARIEKIYVARNGIDPSCLGGEFEFVQAPSVWGNTALGVGERAVLFVSEIAGRLYEAPWRGHLVIEHIEGGRTPASRLPSCGWTSECQRRSESRLGRTLVARTPPRSA
ncbi:MULTISPECIES: hypothetical protein [Corallococcus]|uniref:hypothetical protein n=1 Tax=Corallococcus TaxID=83461 RepID=UPI0011814475|nr:MULTISPECIES: hypothetical protein [Corallococcus]NBD11799.1 hypothetical protein [Corallococcus silvisoli]TSC23552.1 hypothetical protein FOF48_28755 [Corallococcus sp. Z5C101001]